MNDDTLKGVPVTKRPSATPISASGIAVRITSGSRYERNVASITVKTSTTAMRITIANSRNDCCCSWYSPPIDARYPGGNGVCDSARRTPATTDERFAPEIVAVIRTSRAPFCSKIVVARRGGVSCASDVQRDRTVRRRDAGGVLPERLAGYGHAHRNQVDGTGKVGGDGTLGLSRQRVRERTLLPAERGERARIRHDANRRIRVNDAGEHVGDAADRGDRLRDAVRATHQRRLIRSLERDLERRGNSRYVVDHVLENLMEADVRRRDRGGHQVAQPIADLGIAGAPARRL